MLMTFFLESSGLGQISLGFRFFEQAAEKAVAWFLSHLGQSGSP